MTATKNAENMRQAKIRFCLIVEQILAFVSSPKMLYSNSLDIVDIT